MPFQTSNQLSNEHDLYSDYEEPSPMQLVLQQLANEDRIHVKRSAEGHSTVILSADYSTSVSVGGWLSGQDMCEGWIQKYSLWTEEADNNCIRIRLMIETDVVPELPEFEGCENNALCNLDDFSTFTITIKRDCVLDESVAIHEISQEDNTHAHVQAFIDSHQRGLITSIYDAIDNQKKDSLRYFIKIIVHEFPEKISEVFCEIVSHIGCRISLNRQFDVEYIFPILQYLLNNGANINHPNIWGDTPLMVSISFNAIEMQHFLMAVPDCDLNYKNCKSNLDYDSIPMTPLLLAIIYQYTESALSLILDPRIDIHLTNSKYSPLTLAQKMKNDIVIQALLDHGA